MNPSDFGHFFEAVHRRPPFRWQSRLASQVAEQGWPGMVKLPTGAGKTALIDIAVFHLALDAEKAAANRRAGRRIFFVVDRRLVVDEAHRRAKHIEQVLREATEGILAEAAARLRGLIDEANAPPLLVRRLRGGVPREKNFIDNPLQPAVVLSTVDQVGSRILFRGYGVSEFMRPIHAALVGVDSLILLDEAHLSRPFVETLQLVRRYQQTPAWAKQAVGTPVTLVEMTATPRPGETPFELAVEDDADESLAQRLAAAKPTELIEVPTEKEDRLAASETLARSLAEHAERLMEELIPSVATPVVGAVANRVLTARLACEALRQSEKVEAILLTGRMRPLDRAAIEDAYHQRIRADRNKTDNPKPLFVVATQTIEVGADLDFDGLVTESAALDALRQRFGRLNRLGQRPWSRAAIVHDKQAPKDDPVYGGARLETWKWLKTKATRPRRATYLVLDMGVRALEPSLPTGDALKPLLTPTRPAPVLMPAHLDMLVQTSPSPAVEPDLALLLHGAGSQRADVQLVWRADLPDRLTKDNEKAALDTIAMLPPVSEEALSLPLATARRVLLNLEPEDLSDVEGGADIVDTVGHQRTPWVAHWHGREKSSVGPAEDIRTGDTVVLPATYGGLDRIAGEPPLPLDVGDRAAQLRRGLALLRLHPALVAGWFTHEAVPETVNQARLVVKELLAILPEAEDAQAEAQAVAMILADLPGLDPSVCNLLARLAKVGEAYPYPSDTSPAGVLLAEPRNTAPAFTDEDDSSSLTREVTLHAHCHGVGAQAAKYATSMELSPLLAGDAALAGRLHDLGKADPRFQAWLRAGDRVAARRAPELLAKSSLRAQDCSARERARRLAGYPQGTRHECYSVAVLGANVNLLLKATDAELVAYLVGTHHGRGRPFMPAVHDPGTSMRFVFDSHALEWSGRHGLENLESGWTERFWRLTRYYGYWGLAWIETLVRLADYRQSAREMED